MIAATAWSDDHVVEIRFDATKWFENASDLEIVELAREGWANGSTSDYVADFFRYDETKDLFDYLEAKETVRRFDPFGEEVGYGCRVDSSAALDWVTAHRMHLLLRLESSPAE